MQTARQRLLEMTEGNPHFLSVFSSFLHLMSLSIARLVLPTGLSVKEGLMSFDRLHYSEGEGALIGPQCVASFHNISYVF